MLFGPGGVGRFRVLGIETSAGLISNDPTAFATGVTFAGGGSFTGKMIPIYVPEPQTYALLLVGALVCAGGSGRFAPSPADKARRQLRGAFSAPCGPRADLDIPSRSALSRLLT